MNVPPLSVIAVPPMLVALGQNGRSYGSRTAIGERGQLRQAKLLPLAGFKEVIFAVVNCGKLIAEESLLIVT